MYSISRYATPDLELAPIQITSWLETWFQFSCVKLKGHPGRVHFLLFRITCLSRRELEQQQKIWAVASAARKPEINVIDGGSLEIRWRFDDTIAWGELLCFTSALFTHSEGKPVQIQLNAAPVADGWEKRHFGLALFGLVKGGAFHLLAIWLKAPPHGLTGIFKATRWKEEERLIKAFQLIQSLEQSLGTSDGTAFRYEAEGPHQATIIKEYLMSYFGYRNEVETEGRTIIARVKADELALAVGAQQFPDEAQSIFSPKTNWFRETFVKLTFGWHESLRNFSFRVMSLAGLTALCFGGAVYLDGPLQTWANVTGVIVGTCLLFALIHNTKLLFQTRRQMKAGLGKLYYKPSQITEVPAEESRAFTNPVLEKFSADLVELGGQWLVDFRTSGDRSFCRAFYFQKHHSVVQLSVLLRHDKLQFLPGTLAALICSYFAVGHAGTLANKGGYKRRLRKEAVVQILPDCLDMAQLLKAHSEFMEGIERPDQRTVQLDKDEFLNRLRSDHDLDSKLNLEYGIFRLSDAFHQLFKIPRKGIKVIKVPTPHLDAWF